MAMQVNLDATSGLAQSPRLSEEIRTPLLNAFMDDMTIVVPIKEHAHTTLTWLDELISWCRMSFKPKKIHKPVDCEG